MCVLRLAAAAVETVVLCPTPIGRLMASYKTHAVFRLTTQNNGANICPPPDKWEAMIARRQTLAGEKGGDGGETAIPID